MRESIEDIQNRQNQIRNMERLASVKSARNSSATDSQAMTTYRPIEITKIKASIATVNCRPGLPKSPRNGAQKQNSIFSK
jgi:hypothetical protein